MLGLIALLAIIGLAVGCGTDAEDQTIITITDIPGANGFYGFIVLSNEKAGADGDLVAYAAAAKTVAGGSLTCEMVDASGEIYGKDKDMWVFVGIADSAATAETAAKLGIFKTDSKKAVTKTENYFSAKVFNSELIELYGTANDIVDAVYAGTYVCNYTNSGGSAKTENIELAEKSFKVWDSPTDNLTFTMTKGWEKINTSSGVTGYTIGFKFTGNITAASVVAASGGNPKSLYGYKTAPNFDQADIDSKTEAWMSIFFNDAGDFVRTAFSKSGSDQSTVIITGGDDKTVRVYKK